MNSTVNPSARRLKLPDSTMPPTRKVRSTGASFAAIWLGLKKNTTLPWNALSTSAAAIAINASPAAMAIMR